MQFITIAGNVGKDAATKEVGGTDVTEWSVAVSNGRDNASTWFKCSLWGARGGKVAGYIRKGDKITVAGKLTVGVYDGKPDLKIDVSEVTLQGGKQEASGRSYQDEGASRPKPHNSSTYDDDLDQEIPF